MPRPPGMADPDKWTLNLPPGPDCSVGYSSNEFVSEDGSSLPGRENEDKFYTCHYQGKIQLYMVLDGHDGTRACEFAQKHLPSVLLSSELDGGVEMVGRAMRWAFLNTEREFFLGIDPHITRKITLQIEIQKARNSAEALSMFPDQVEEIQRLDNQIKGGTTAVLAILYNGYLHIANVGDSRALLCYEGRDGHLHVEQLSVDHKTSNEDELRRLEDCGLNPNELRRHKRLGIQQNTRSIGDHSIKGGYKDIDVISHATKEPGTAEPFIAMPVDLRNIFSGFLVLMSDGLYDAYQLYTQRPAFVNQDLGYLIAQEMKQSTDIAAVAHNVVEKVKQLYRSTCKKNVCKGRLDDITLIIRNLNFPMGSLSHTVSYPGSLHESGVSYPPIHTAPILHNARQNVFFPNPPYPHETPHGYATNVPPEYRDRSRLPPSGYMYGPRPHPPVGGYLTQPHGVSRVISDPKLQPSNADVSIGGGPSVGTEPGYQIGYDGYQHPQQQPHWSIQSQHQQPQQQPLWSMHPQQHPPQQPLWSTQSQQHPPQQPLQQPPQDPIFTVGDPHTSQPRPHLATQISTTPSQSTVRPRTNTHSYVNVSPSSTSTTVTAPTTVTAVGTFSNNGGLTPHESPAHSTPLQVPRNISHGYQNVSLSPTVHEQKRYSDSQLEEQMQALNLEATSNATPDRNAHTPPPMGNHPSHYSPVLRSVTKSPVPLPRRDLKPIQPKNSDLKPKDSSDEFDLYGWKADDVTPMSSQPSSLVANSEGGTLTGPPHEEETIDKPDSDSERNEDGENIGVLTLPGDPLLSDFSETSDLEEEEKDVDPDGMIKSHVKFDSKFDMNLSWDDL